MGLSVFITRSAVLATSLVLSACSSLPDFQLPTIFDGDQHERLQQVADQGDANNQYRVGIRYFHGTEVDQDYGEAARWFEMAARQGHRDARYMLGIVYYTGAGVDQDHVQGVRWFKQAAESGQIRAQYQLGDAYMNGRGVKIDRPWGARWYGRAARLDHSEAKFSLGIAYAKGLGLPKSSYQASKWLSLAAEVDVPLAVEAKDKLVSRLSESQQKRVASWAARWKPMDKLSAYKDQATIIYLQYRLKQLGYDPGFADGIAGLKTHAQTERFLKAESKSGSSDLELLRLLGAPL
ncbi:MAG: sel1 repeat family protein [Gammaproteobacteria bacterium]|nr:sel1 repeat family protein [Gammaproteobacteria bacterium]